MAVQENRCRLKRCAMLLAALAAWAGAAQAQQVCKEDLRVLSQPRDGLTLLEKYKDEFKALGGASFNIDNLNENDRRTKTRADASTVGKYHVYYVDEANVPLFAQSKWIVPLGKFSFLEALDAQRTLFQVRAQYLLALADAHRAAGELDRLLGNEGEAIPAATLTTATPAAR